MTVTLFDLERCPLKEIGECDSSSWMVRSDGYGWWLWCGGWSCPLGDRSRSDDD